MYQDDGTGRVYVIGARGATGLVLTVGSEKFEESGQSIVRGTLDYLQGLKVCFVLYVLITHTYTFVLIKTGECVMKRTCLMVVVMCRCLESRELSEFFLLVCH